ncbi:MAG: M23 family metallopeptidase [Acidobacteriota bacterium]
MNLEKKIYFIFNISLFILICLTGLTSICYPQKTSPSRILSFDLESRSSQPGEAIFIRLENVPSFRQAILRFQEKKIPLINFGDDGKLITVIGLDMDLQPGTYSLRATLILPDGSLLTEKKQIVVKEKSFPVKRLWVEEKFVTPPPEVRERIQREARILQGIFSLVSPEWYGEGRFLLPVNGEVNPNFGERRVYNNQPRSAHNGVDISSPSGTPIIASNSGKVVLASDLYFAGQTVIIDHGLGVFTFYCHLSEIAVKRGALVKKGELIGKVGATGRVTGPHLHWSVRINDSRVDPLSLLSLNFPE